MWTHSLILTQEKNINHSDLQAMLAVPVPHENNSFSETLMMFPAERLNKPAIPDRSVGRGYVCTQLCHTLLKGLIKTQIYFLTGSSVPQ